MKDIFAEIAAQRVQYRDQQLVQPQPPAIPDTILPMNQEPGTALFRPSRKIATAEELRAELERYRKQYARFLDNYAPAPAPTRIVEELNVFDWRIETEADRMDFCAAMQGAGTWVEVAIPHYGPPLGRAATYYRTCFEITPDIEKKAAWFICFKGVDYKAHVFINGAYIGSHQGFFAPFEFEITPYARPGTNTLFVKVENDYIFMGSRNQTGEQRFEGEKLYAATGCGYDDPEIGWHHCPPGMGIYQDVCVEARNRLYIHDVFVRPLAAQNSAEAWIEIFNCDVQPKSVLLDLSVFGQNFQETVFEHLKYTPSGVYIPGLGDLDKNVESSIPLLIEAGINLLKIPFAMPGARRWAPDTPWLYQLQVRVLDEKGHCVDTGKQHFGMRSFHMDQTREVKGGLFLNDLPIKLRGANTMGHLQQCVLKKNRDQLCDDILLAKICHMNFLRLTQRPVQPEIYDMCDKLGMMTQTDLPLFGVLRRPGFVEAVRQCEEMERLVRKHPSNIMVSYINEPFPNAMGKPHRHLTRAELTAFYQAADAVVRLANPDRVIKAVDGDYDPPGPGMPDNHCYCGWYIGHGIELGRLYKGYWQPVKPGWYFGCGEFGAEGLDPVDIMRKYYPKHWLPQTAEEESEWNPDQIVNAQTGKFHYMWFDTQASLDDWVRASQAHQEWVVRIMTEAFRRNRMMHSFAVHLFIDAFPAGWMKTIMDVDRAPKPAYFSYRDALTPLMVSLRCDRTVFFTGESIPVEAWICNDRTEAPETATLCYQLEMNGEVLQCGRISVRIPVFDVFCPGILNFTAPAVEGRNHGVIRLGLLSPDGAVIHDNALAVDILPGVEKKNRNAVVLGRPNGVAYQLAEELGIDAGRKSVFHAGDLILVDDLEMYRACSSAIESAVKRGALVVFLELPLGEHRIGASIVKVMACGMGKRHFVSRNTGHPLVKGFQAYDFKFWYDAGVDHPTPLLSTVIESPRWEPILTSGNGDWQGHWRPNPVAAEKKEGSGTWRICQLHLAGRVRGNPVAEIFARRLLEK